MTRRRDVTAVVLAGGGSTRFGTGWKATATLGGRPLVERVVDRVRAATGRPPVVAAGTTEKRSAIDATLTQSVRYVDDDSRFAGPLAGLFGALDSVDTATVFVCGCDMPLVSPRVVSWLVARQMATGVDATVPVDDTCEPQPLHAVYRTAALADARENGLDDHRLRSLLSDLQTATVRATALPDALDLSRSTTNVNTRADLVAAERACRAKESPPNSYSRHPALVRPPGRIAVFRCLHRQVSSQMATKVTVTCADCSYSAEYDSLRVARAALDDHEQTTGHRVDWDIGRLATGVERAGSDAGVCGLDSCNPESPLVHDWDE